MKITQSEAVQTTRRDNREERSRLELRRRPVADLTQRQLDDAVGGHPHDTCDATCPETCGDGRTCSHSCGGTCGTTCGDTCDPGGCDPDSTSPERCL